MKKFEKIGYHSNFDFECNTERAFKESLSSVYSSGEIIVRIGPNFVATSVISGNDYKEFRSFQ